MAKRAKDVKTAAKKKATAGAAKVQKTIKRAPKPAPKAKALAGKKPAKVVAGQLGGEKMRVPLAQVFVAKENPRHGQPVEHPDEITATITHHGQLQGLICYRSARGYEATDGARRHFGLTAAHAAGVAHAAEADIEVFPKQQAIERGLAAQVERVDLHAATEAVTFAELLRKGDDAKAIAARFGKTERFVHQRAALASLQAPILKALRANELDIKEAEAWANIPEERRLGLWKRLGGPKASDWQLREARDEKVVTLATKVGRLVGEADYEAAGGVIERDLFPEAEDGGDVKMRDLALVEKIALEKIDAKLADVRAEGWGWVVYSENGRHMGEHAGRYDPASGKANAENRTERGAFISLNRDGELVVERNLISVKQAAAAAKKAAKADPKAKPETRPDYTGRSHEMATHGASVLVARAVADQPDVAVIALLACLARQVFAEELDTRYTSKVVDIVIDPVRRRPDTPLKSDKEFDVLRSAWADKLTPGAADLENHIAGFDDDSKLRLLAFMVGASIGFISDKLHPKESRVDHLVALGRLARAEAGGFEVTAEFTSGMSLAALQAACGEMGIEAPEKKAAAAEAVAIAAPDKRWTPPLVRQLVGEAVEPATAKKAPAKTRGRK